MRFQKNPVVLPNNETLFTGTSKLGYTGPWIVAGIVFQIFSFNECFLKLSCLRACLCVLFSYSLCFIPLISQKEGTPLPGPVFLWNSILGVQEKHTGQNICLDQNIRLYLLNNPQKSFLSFILYLFHLRAKYDTRNGIFWPILLFF